MDPLSEVLRAVRLTGGIFLDARFTAPWAVTAQITPEDCQPFLAMPKAVIAYHVAIEGRFALLLDGVPVTEVAAGEIVIFPRNDPHVLASAPGVPAIGADDLIQPSADGGLARIVHGGGGPATRLVCGFLASEEPASPLFAALPPLMKLDVRQAASREWVEATVRFAADALMEGRAASSAVMARLSELLLVEAVRSYVASAEGPAAGWLRGLTDPQVGRAMALIHTGIAAPWSVERLAREAALSRSAFVERFTALVGMPPIRYLTHWRLVSARQRLREQPVSIAQLAHSVGYESEAAFSRAFKRAFGVAPAQWRAAGDLPVRDPG